MKPIQFPLSHALLAHFANHYLEFIALYQARVIDYATACDWCNQIGSYVQTTYYSEAKAAA